MRLRKEHLIGCSAERLWRLMFDPDFDRRHNLEANGMREHALVSLDTTGEVWQLRTRSTPATSMPRFVQGWIDQSIFFDTTVTHAVGSMIGDATMGMSVMPGQVRMGFRMETIPDGPDRCRRILDWEVKIAGVGSLVERFILKEINRGSEASARFINEWVHAATFTEPTKPLERQEKLSQSAAEINLTEHCNLKCAGCNHASHQLPERFASLAACRRDLAALAAVMHLDELKLVGGEPLLHPELIEFLKMARASGVADQITLVTNGVKLHKMPKEVYRLINRLWVSVYPGVKLAFDPAEVERLCRDHGVVLWRKETPSFSLSLLNRKIEDQELVRDIYRECGYAHVWSCHTIYQGRYYKCSPGPFVGARLALLGIDYRGQETDGVALHDNPQLHDQLRSYLADDQPLPACAYCLAHLGRDIPSRQLNRAALAAELAEDQSNLLPLFHPDRIPHRLRAK